MENEIDSIQDTNETLSLIKKAYDFMCEEPQTYVFTMIYVHQQILKLYDEIITKMNENLLKIKQ